MRRPLPQFNGFTSRGARDRCVIALAAADEPLAPTAAAASSTLKGERRDSSVRDRDIRRATEALARDGI